MKFVKHLLFVVVLLVSTQVQAQYEYIFTNYFMSPTTLNPAMTGAYEGTYRVGGLQRQQWPIVGSTFTTSSVFIDMPLLMIGKRHWIGAGFNFYNDVAKANASDNLVKLTQRVPSLSAAFHYALDKKSKNILTLGVKGGSTIYNVNLPVTSLLTYSEIKNNAADPTWRPQDLKSSFGDISLGLMLKSKIDKKSDFTTGVALGHITTPKIGKFGAKDYKLPMATTIHAEYNRMINKQLSISPNVLFRTISGSKDFSLQGVVGYILDPKKKDLNLKAGLGFRGIGAQSHLVDILLGADYKNYKFMMAYDIQSSATASAGSTLELALHYTGKVYKKPDVKKNHFCPKY